jgi:signal transduction histidine kinase
MKLQAKVTLGSMLLAIIIVVLVSGVDVGSFMDFQLQSTLERAAGIKDVAKDAVIETLNRRQDVSLREKLRDPELNQKLVKLTGSLNGVLSIDMVSAENGEVMASTLVDRVGTKDTEPDFSKLVRQGGWFEKLNELLFKHGRYYMLQDPVGVSSTLFWVRVVISPVLIRPSLKETLYQKAEVAILSVAGAVLLTFLFSMALFRSLGNIGHMLDRAASGEYELEVLRSDKTATDELSVMASKVNLLGQRLRGAQFEVSDLRGNIDHLLQDLEDAVFIFNRELRLVFASGSVEKFLGRERSDLPGQPISSLFPPSTTLGLLVAQSSQTGRSIRNRRVPVAAANQTLPGPAIVLLSVDILESLPGGPAAASGVLVRLSDPEAQRKINRELQTADRLSAISRISSGVAHEVKNPLNAILLHVEVARSKLSRGDTDVAEQMEIISREILRLDRVVRTFLDFTRPVELRMDNIPVQELVQEIVDLARPQTTAANIQVSVILEAEGVEVRVDRDLLKQAMLNVVVNAIQAMPEGGELHFEATASEDTAELRISDSGAGISDDVRDKIFRLYFSTKQQGSGIGLAMTFRIVQLHDGTIDFTSEPGKGTTFLIRLPIAV